LIGFSDLKDSGFYGLHFTQYFHGELLFGEGSVGEVCRLDLRAGLEDVEKRKFLTLPGLELRPFGYPARRQ
jgi:hypothetical protein